MLDNCVLCGSMKRNLAVPSLFSDKEVGRRLLIFRKGLGLSQKDMAEKYGSEGEGQMWSHYETGRTTFPLEIAHRLTMDYGLDIGWIYQGRMQLIVGRPAEIITKGEEALAAGSKRRRR